MTHSKSWVQKKILISAYSCEPGKGSEPGVGWAWAQELAKHFEVWVITRSSNRETIESWVSANNSARIHWIYYDLPQWAKFWKKGNRGVHLYYVLWQWGAYHKVRKIHKTIHFDAAHHITFVNYWLPTFLPFLGIPFIWGPLGGGETTAQIFMAQLDPKARSYETLRNIVRRLSEWSPLTRAAATKCFAAIATSSETAERLRCMGVKRIELISQVAMSDEELRAFDDHLQSDHKIFRFISVGNLLHLKGFDLGLRAFSMLVKVYPHTQYWIVGDGPEQAKLESIAGDLGIIDRVVFYGRIPKDDAIKKISESDVMVFPSMHDSGGWVCAEAMALGKPVICLDVGGPGLQVTPETGYKIKLQSYDQVIRDIYTAMIDVIEDEPTRRGMSVAGKRRVSQLMGWRFKSDQILSIYKDIFGGPESLMTHSERQ